MAITAILLWSCFGSGPQTAADKRELACRYAAAYADRAPVLAALDELCNTGADEQALQGAVDAALRELRTCHERANE